MRAIVRCVRRACGFASRLPALVRGAVGFAAVAGTPSDALQLVRARIAWTRGLRRLAGPPRTIEATVRPLGGAVRLRTHETDPSVLAEIVLHREYDGTIAVAERRGPPRLVVDLGANIGLAGRRFLACWPGARLIAVEPDPGNAHLLRENLELLARCGRGGHHRVVEVCVAARSGTVRLDAGNGAWGRRMKDAASPAHDAIEVSAITMSEVLEREPATAAIDLLKCDIEGAEAELFRDCASWIGRVRTAVVECHGDYDGDALLADLERNGSDLALVERHAKPEHGLEVVVLARRGRAAGPAAGPLAAIGPGELAVAAGGRLRPAA